MSNKDQFKKPKARHVGGSLLEKDKELLQEMNALGQDNEVEEPKTHSLTILPSHIEKIRNYVHFKKFNGDPYYTQGKMLQEAIDLFLSSISDEIPERPEEVKRSERKRSGRKHKVNHSKNNKLFNS